MDPRIFGLDAQTLFDTCVTLVAMLALFFILSYFLFNPTRNLLEKRKNLIAGQLEEAETEKNKAMEMKQEYSTRLAQVDEESAEMMAAARKKAKAREAEIIAEASNEAQVMKARAEREISLEKARVRDEMKQEMVQVATLMAGKFVSESMDEKTQAGLVEETLKEMGDDTWQN